MRHWPVVLASGSPRRKELLLELIDDFEVVLSDVDEEALTREDPVETAETLALAKAQAVQRLRMESLVIGGDTVVALREGSGFLQLAKPASNQLAVEMLSMLSGREHVVVTGVALVWPNGERVFSEVTKVTFKSLSRSEIEAYVATGESLDKAGGYASQGGAASFISKLEGSRSNVIGLPLERLREEFRSITETSA